MLHTILQSLLLALVLIASVEGTIDRASEGHPHGGEATHELAALDAHDHAGLSDSDEESIDSHCEHCCHGHTSSITSTATLKPLNTRRSCAKIGYVGHIVMLPQAPPTPPPTV